MAKKLLIPVSADIIKNQRIADYNKMMENKGSHSRLISLGEFPPPDLNYELRYKVLRQSLFMESVHKRVTCDFEGALTTFMDICLRMLSDTYKTKESELPKQHMLLLTDVDGQGWEFKLNFNYDEREPELLELVLLVINTSGEEETVERHPITKELIEKYGDPREISAWWLGNMILDDYNAVVPASINQGKILKDAELRVKDDTNQNKT